ncbi:MAG: hypothetical protein DRO89_05930 [Candidatus Altiarchaeales archaeon]|nr:MAG: hypothetical protein DRO89_05930 [Candidatus Altiarchaeales archaeon]
MTTILVAYDEGRIIGNDGRIPWSIPADLRRFQNLTTGNAVIMGRKTFESLPHGPLPDRMNIVISRTRLPTKPPESRTEGVLWVCDPQDAIQFAWDRQLKPFVSGGEQIYRHFLHKGLIHKIIATEVKGRHEGDTYFPRLYEYEGWTGQVMEELGAYRIVEYLSLRALRQQRNDLKQQLAIVGEKYSALRKERDKLIAKVLQYNSSSSDTNALRTKLQALRKKLNAYEQRAIQEYRHQQDYLPYDDDDRR